MGPRTASTTRLTHRQAALIRIWGNKCSENVSVRLVAAPLMQDVQDIPAERLRCWQSNPHVQADEFHENPD